MRGVCHMQRRLLSPSVHKQFVSHVVQPCVDRLRRFPEPASHASGRGRVYASSSDVGAVSPVVQGANGDSPAVAFRPRSRVAKIKENKALVGESIEVRGWVRTVRAQKTFAFLEVNDGSSLAGLQVVVAEDAEGHSLVRDGAITTGCSVAAFGELVESPGGKQAVELKASTLRLIGSCDSGTYPLQKKRHTLEFLRGIAHLRARTNTISAVARVRSALAQATHDFFCAQGFLYVHTPIISTSDCEGAGEMFQVTTLLSEMEASAAGAAGAGAPPPMSKAELEEAVAAQGAVVKAAKAAAKETGAEADAQAAQAEVAALLQLKAQAEAAVEPVVAADGAVDYGRDFFGQRAYLTVSGQLNGEMYACAMGDIYTFGPTFRAENSNTSRHLAEFWMIEPELAFADLADNIACAEAYLQHCVHHVLEHCAEDLAFFDARVEKGLLARLRAVAAQPFVHITYTDAVERLRASGAKFEYPVEWGCDLQSEHERWLTEVAFEGVPVAVTDYPKDIKAFYMRLNDDGRTVAAVDVLVPRVGELIGGAQREDRIDVLLDRMQKADLDPEDYKAYLDLRRYGSVPHAGFGLGFERLVQFATGIENIRDVIPFPRYPGHAEF
eukprot:jgi/Ulvmu1/5376/UM022_0171.1